MVSAQTFRDRDGLRLEIKAHEKTPHVMITSQFTQAIHGATRTFSTSAARDVAKAILSAAHDVEVREGFDVARSPHSCQVCTREIVMCAGAPLSACTDCVITGKIFRDAHDLLVVALNEAIARRGMGPEAAAMGVLHDWIVRQRKEEG